MSRIELATWIQCTSFYGIRTNTRTRVTMRNQGRLGESEESKQSVHMYS